MAGGIPEAHIDAVTEPGRVAAREERPEASEEELRRLLFDLTESRLWSRPDEWPTEK